MDEILEEILERKEIICDSNAFDLMYGVKMYLQKHSTLDETFVGRVRITLANSRGCYVQVFYEALFRNCPQALRYFYPGFTGKPLHINLKNII